MTTQTVYLERERVDFWQLAKEPGSTSYVDPLGPKDCMTHSAARAVMRATEGVRPAGTTGVWPPTGYAIRHECRDSSGQRDTTAGVNHTQVRDAVRRLYGVVLTPLWGVPFEQLLDALEATHGAMVSVWYRRIRDTPSRRGSFTFYENHELWIPRVDRAAGLFKDVVEPLADGRQTGLYHGPGDYPVSLIRAAAGELNVASSGYRALGAGLVYAMLTAPTGTPPVASVQPRVVTSAPTPSERNVMIPQGGLAITSSHTMSLAAGQPLFRYPGGPRVTAMSRAGKVAYMGTAGGSWRAVRVSTAAPYADHLSRPTVLYVPAAAGPVEAR